MRVWSQLRIVGYGQTASYTTIAERIGTPQGARAVGRANGLNPIAIVTPCHRIVAASGALTGYAGGLWRKEWLLRHEQAHPTPASR
jgi:O-6-methylguanine DNA methyltransferase